MSKLNLFPAVLFFLGFPLAGVLAAEPVVDIIGQENHRPAVRRPRLIDPSGLDAPEVLRDLGQLGGPAVARGPASILSPGGATYLVSPLFPTLSQGEPAWYRHPSSLSAGSPTPTPRPNDLLGSDRAPAHPMDGMWRYYDSRGLSR